MKVQTKERLKIFFMMKLKEIGLFIGLLVLVISIIALMLIVLYGLFYVLSISPEIVMTILAYTFLIIGVSLSIIVLACLTLYWIKDNWEKSCKIEKRQTRLKNKKLRPKSR